MEMPPAPSAPESPEPPSQDVPGYREVLHELLDLGAELSRIIVQRAAEPSTPVAEAAVAFDRVSRGTRRTILLLRHLDEPAKPSAARHRTVARKRILRDVEDAIDLAWDNERLEPLAEAEKADLRGELLDRLDAPDTEEDIANRPVEEIVREICRDLDIIHDNIGRRGRRRTPADIEALNARAAKPRGEPGNPPRPDCPRNDQPLEPMSLNDIILRHVADASPGFPGHGGGQSPRAGPS